MAVTQDAGRPRAAKTGSRKQKEQETKPAFEMEKIKELFQQQQNLGNISAERVQRALPWDGTSFTAALQWAPIFPCSPASASICY